MHPVGVDRGIGGEDVGAHRGGNGDDGVGRLVGGALDPRGDGVPAAELLGLPRPQRLQGVRGDHVRHAVQQPGEVAGEVGVPGVRVHQVGAGAAVGDGQVDAEGRERRWRRRARRGRRTPVCPLVAPGAPKPCTRVGEVARARSAGPARHVHPGAAVDLGWVLLAQHVDPHATNASRSNCSGSAGVTRGSCR